jgi:peptidyl-prolyl cis-trans isomerase B (cyclophilin B)
MHAEAPFLDRQYTAFGQVTSGLEVVDKIVNQPRDGNDRPKTNPAKINSVTIEEN